MLKVLEENHIITDADIEGQYWKKEIVAEMKRLRRTDPNPDFQESVKYQSGYIDMRALYYKAYENVADLPKWSKAVIEY